MTGNDVSVIIPTYNHACYLGEAIRSVLAQTSTVRELIVVDDGSKDHTKEVVAQFDGPIRYHYQENRGLSAARNVGIRLAQSDWLAFLDADDWWLPEKIARQLEVASGEGRPDLVYAAHWALMPDGRKLLIPATPRHKLWPRLRYVNCLTGSGSAFLARKEMLLNVGGFDENLRACEDWDMWVRLASIGCSFGVVDEPVCTIRCLTDSMSNANPERMLANTEKILEKSLLLGLRGWRRSAWRQRIRAAELFRASISARRAEPQNSFSYLCRSFYQWPFPLFLPKRVVAFLVEVRGKLLRNGRRGVAVVPRASGNTKHVKESGGR